MIQYNILNKKYLKKFKTVTKKNNYDESKYNWKLFHRNYELSNDTHCKQIDHDMLPLILFGFCDDHQIIDLNDIKIKITQLLSKLDEDERKKMFDHFRVIHLSFHNDLTFLLQTMQCYDNKQNFHIMYDILKVLLIHGLNTEMNRFYKTFYPDYLHLYFELISIVTSDNIHIFEIMSTDKGYKPKWVNNAIRDWHITPNIIMYLIRNGHKMFECCEENPMELLQYLGQPTYIAKKLNFYLFAVYKLYHRVKNEYFETLKLYIYSQQSIHIIIDYVMDRYDSSNALIEYMSNINNEYVQSCLRYVNYERWKSVIGPMRIHDNIDVLEESMTIIVKDLHFKIRNIENISALTTIYEIKEKIFKDTEIKTEKQRLVSGELSLLLNDQNTVSYYNIINNDKIWLVKN
eukprot:142221_1